MAVYASKDMNDLIKTWNEMTSDIVKIKNVIARNTMGEVKDVLKDRFGYAYFIENRAYKTADDIGKADRCTTIRDMNGYFMTIVITYERR